MVGRPKTVSGSIMSTFHCRYCGERNLLPLTTPAPQELTDPERERLVFAVIDALIYELTYNAQEPARIGNRVLNLKYSRQDPGEREKLLIFAERRGVTSASASAGVSEAHGTIKRILKTNASVMRQ